MGAEHRCDVLPSTALDDRLNSRSLPTHPPTAVTITDQETAPAATTSAADALIQFSGSDATGVAFTCALTSEGTVAAQPTVLSGGSRSQMVPLTLGQPFNCTSPQRLHWLLPGKWRLAVTGADPGGNVAAPVEWAWEVAYPPAGVLYTRFLSGPYGLQPKSGLAFNLTTLDASGAEAQAPQGHECRLQALDGGAGPGADDAGGAYAPCTSPAAVPGDVQDGRYRFYARARGGSGAPGTEAVSDFTVDSVAPVVTFEGGFEGRPCLLCWGGTPAVLCSASPAPHQPPPPSSQLSRGPQSRAGRQLHRLPLHIQRGGQRLLLRHRSRRLWGRAAGRPGRRRFRALHLPRPPVQPD